MFRTQATLSAVAGISDRYGRGGDNLLPYHGTEHTRGVVERLRIIAHAMGLSQHHVALVEIACAFHDAVQRWEEMVRDDGAIIRKRHVGANEAASALEACEWMDSNGYGGKGCQKLVTEAIMATVPVWDPELATVVQKIDINTHPVVRVVAMSDLANVGMNPEAYIEEAEPLFLEENLDIFRAIRSESTAPLDKQGWYLERYRIWKASQVSFGKGRKARFPKDIEGLGELAKHNLSVLFSRFDESIALAEEQSAWANQATFEQVWQLLQSS